MQLIKDHQQMVKFVNSYFDSHDPLVTELSTRFPFRRRFDHCLRCSIWARRIALVENADADITIISALFHDIGKSVGGETAQNHGEVGAQICDDYLNSVAYNRRKIAKITKIIRSHSNHANESDASLEAKVVSDADLIDETGATAVLWDAMACAREDAPSYEKVCDRTKMYYAKLKGTLPNRLHTTTAKQILSGRFLFVDTFLKNLEYELGRSETVP
jgi:uncharacterized protein